jgi:hypothetical protein
MTGLSLDTESIATSICYSPNFRKHIAPSLRHIINHSGRLFRQSEETKPQICSQKYEGETMAMYTAKLKTWANNQANKVADSISTWETADQSRKKIETATKVATKIGQQGRSNRNVAFLAMQANGGLHNNQTAFDTDSAPIGINNRCTGCISQWRQRIVRLQTATRE